MTKNNYLSFVTVIISCYSEERFILRRKEYLEKYNVYNIVKII